MGQRHDWVDAAKGLSIILVVMMYSAYNVGKYTGDRKSTRLNSSH